MPLFSIILPTYNRASFLRRSIGSILSQTFSDFELLIIDDASTDNTKEIIDGFKDERIRYIRNEKNIERSASRNKGIELSTGKYICFLDSDDAFRQDHLKIFYDFIINNNEPSGLIYSAFQRNFDNGETEEISMFPAQEENIIEWIIKEQLPPPSTVCIRKEILVKPNFNANFVINEDVELWVRIASEYPLFFTNKTTLDFYIHDKNTKFVNNDPCFEQMKVLKYIYNDKKLRKNISKKFKNERIKSLRAQRIKAFSDANKFGKLNLLILEYLFCYPFSVQNKYRLYLLLSNFPVIRWFVKSYSAIKNK